MSKVWLLVAASLMPAAVLAQPAGQPPPGPTTGLATLVAELERNNPELQAAQREIDMRLARIAPAGAPPDPTLSAGYMSGFLRPPFFPSTATPNGYVQVGISQEFPYPGKLDLRSRIASTEASATRWNYEDLRLRRIAELKGDYVEYQLAERSLDIIRKNKQLLDQFERTAESRFSVGKAAQQDVLKAQLEISLLLERIAIVERQRDALRARINGLLYRSPDAPLDPAFELSTVPLSDDLEALRTQAARNDPALKRDERQIDRGQQVFALAKKELLPDFAVALTTQRMPGDMPWMYGFDFMVKVPIFWQRKQRPMIAEANAALEASRRMRENTQATSAVRVTEEYIAATTSRRLMTLYSDSVLPQARLTLESGLAAYQVGNVDFLTLLTNFMTVLTYELSYEEQKAQYLGALARLEPLVGPGLIQ